MEELREKFQYKEGSIEVCFKSLTSKEQYEIIRLILACPGKSVSICTHDMSNSYVNDVLKLLRVEFYQCFRNDFIIQDSL